MKYTATNIISESHRRPDKKKKNPLYRRIIYNLQPEKDDYNCFRRIVFETTLPEETTVKEEQSVIEKLAETHRKENYPDTEKQNHG